MLTCSTPALAVLGAVAGLVVALALIIAAAAARQSKHWCREARRWEAAYHDAVDGAAPFRREPDA